MTSLSITQMPLRVPASLHKDLKKAAQAEGVSLNQYCLYLLAKNMPQLKMAMSQKGEELMLFLQEALIFQRALKGKREQFAEMKPLETPYQRWKKLYENDRSPSD